MKNYDQYYKMLLPNIIMRVKKNIANLSEKKNTKKTYQLYQIVQKDFKDYIL